jgi:hypothetical protein
MPRSYTHLKPRLWLYSLQVQRQQVSQQGLVWQSSQTTTVD